MSFAPPIFFSAGAPSAIAAAVGDFNGDGNLDLAIATCNGCAERGAVAILLGNGDGTFQQPLLYEIGYFPNYVVVADFNHDGNQDLAVVNTGRTTMSLPASLSVLFGNGDGTFQPQVEYSLPERPLSAALGDFNEDGNLDLAIANGVGDSHISPYKVTTLLGNADGSFQPPQQWTANDGPIQVAVRDFDGDGHQDLAVADYGTFWVYGLSGISFLKGNGDGTFQDPQNYFSPMQFASLVADYFRTGDSRLDLFSSGVTQPGGDPATWVLIGNGDDTFQQPMMVFPSAFCFRCAVTSDFDGDLNRDGAIAVSNGFVVLLGNGDGTFQQPAFFEVGWQPYHIAVGDFNGDGKPDVVLTNGSGQQLNVAIFLNTTP